MAWGLLYVSTKGGHEKMKIALAVWKNRISPVFDSSRVVVLVDIENGLVTDKRYVHLKTELPSARAMELVDLGVKVLICGAISQMFACMIESHGIEIVPFIAGNINHVIESYLHGILNSQNFRMPGCGKRHRKRFRGKYR